MADHIKILVVDSNVGALATLRDSLSFAPELEFVGDAGLGPVALTWARTLQPDIVVVAIEEPAARPLSTIELLARGNPSWTVLGLMTQFDPDLFRKAVLAGSTDVLLRTTPPRELRAALVYARRADLLRRTTPSQQHAVAPAGTIISIVGVKGGIGKTTIATNLALSLAAETSSSVVIADLDLPFGDVAMMLDLHPERDVITALDETVLADPDRLQAQLSPGPEGVHVLAAPSAPTNGATFGERDGRMLAKLLSRLASLHDFVIVDTPPGFSETAAAALDVSALALLVTTPEATALRRTQGYLRMLGNLEFSMDKIQVLLNRAHSKTGINDAEMEDILGRPITWRVANDYAALKGAALGLPAILAQPKTPLATSIRAIARRIGGLEVERPRAARWPAWLPQVAMTGLRVTSA
jgi:pilus assembly protein CpaE